MARDYGTAPSEFVGIATRSVAGMLLNTEAFIRGKQKEEEARAEMAAEQQRATLGAHRGRSRGR